MSDWNALVDQARAARQRAYAPYSNFLVGCAIESRDGQVALGANMENACYRLGVCAEQSALAAAQQAFGLENVARMAIVGGPREGAGAGEGADEGAGGGSDPVTPCGGCRQAIMEAANRAGADLAIVCCDASGTNRLETSIAALLPAAFDLD